MITPENLLSLSDVEQKQADSAEKFIDKTIQEAFDNDPEAKKFTVSTTSIAKDADGLTTKVRCHVVDQYVRQAWRISFDEKTRELTFVLPRKRKAKVVAEAA